MERDLENLLSKVEGVGEVRVLLTIKEDSGSLYGSSQSTPSVTGVLIAASGADNLSVVENIQEAVQALFQVEAHKIKVMKMK
jgi:stage III sporulation protein AG